MKKYQKSNSTIKLKKIMILITIFILIFFGITAIVRATEETIDVVCNDYNLYRLLKENIPSSYLSTSIFDGQNDDGTYTLKVKKEKMSEITSLNLIGNESVKITDLTGIENFTYLTTLDLNTNNISDISKLSTLKELTNLNLSKNGIQNISRTIWKHQFNKFKFKQQ